VQELVAGRIQFGGDQLSTCALASITFSADCSASELGAPSVASKKRRSRAGCRCKKREGSPSDARLGASQWKHWPHETLVAVHAAHTMALFVLETREARRATFAS
jgi:hypothetical protein